MTKDTKWNKNGEIVENNTPEIQSFLNKTGAPKVDHYKLIEFGDPVAIEFLEEITVVTHIYSAGDKLSKIAFDHYGDAKLWWVLAWFNAKPTESHCKIGDAIRIPSPIAEVLLQAHKEMGA